jgi:hypothetical protein
LIRVEEVSPGGLGVWLAEQRTEVVGEADTDGGAGVVTVEVDDGEDGGA